ncbi:MAG: DMT family transporter, partial [Burkholderiales bacterium]|nr:DMT family transporter [Burkholderiales bacterium]
FITWIVVEPAPRWTPLLWIALLFSGGLATAVGWLMWQYVLSRLPAGTTSLSSLAVPLIATVSSAIQLGERLRIAEIIGAACIVVALALMSWQSIRNRQRDEPTVVEP